MKEYEDILIEKRKFISRWPKSKKAVIIVSGGLDSITTSARLMEDYGLELFPLHIERGQRNAVAEMGSMEFFSEYFNDRYPNQYHELKVISQAIPPAEIKEDIIPYMKKLGHPLRDPVLFIIGTQYAIALSEKLGTKINTVFSAAVPDDPFPHCNITSIRAMNVAICQNLADWQWIISTPNVDPCLTNEPFDKVREILWANLYKIPLENTVSCYQPPEKDDFTHCGQCLACQRRKEAFKKAQVNDLTKYYK